MEQPFSSQEIFEVINNFDGNKTPGPDDFSLQFFKKSWYYLEDIIVRMFEDFHANPSFPIGFNSSFIFLIPKCNSDKTIDQLRPISLINAPYKIIARTLANRLKKAIPHIISENQNGFVPSRLLMDGVMVVSEVVHMAKKKKKPLLLLKIDFSKAYDCVSHEFLLSVFHRMGFGQKFISWIKVCISNIHFSVLLNGSPSREGIMKRGLRQGDPLSSFLFIIVAEVLSKLLSRDLIKGDLQGCRIGPNLKINHSQFADDTIIFAQPNSIKLLRIKHIMDLFSHLAGLQMNAIKTTLYGIHVSRADLIAFSTIFDCKVGTFPLDYLGIPIGFGRDRISMWNPIINKFKQKLAGWKGSCRKMVDHRNMTMGERKRVERRKLIELYLSPSVTNEGYQKKEEDEVVAIAASSFGPSFRGKLMNNVSSLSTSQISPIWKDLINLQGIDSAHCIVGPNVWNWVLGDGSSFLFWYDTWVDGLIIKDEFPSLFFVCVQKTACVKSFRYPLDMREQQVGWDFNLSLPLSSFNVLKVRQLSALLSRFKLTVSVPDSVKWAAACSDSFSVADSVRIMIQSSNVSYPVWPKVVWGNNVPSKVMIFHWLAIKKCILVKEVLSRRHILPPNQSILCIWCMNNVEGVDHLLLHCKWSSAIWMDLFRWWNIRLVIPGSIVDFSFDWFYGMGIKASRFWKLIGPTTIWAIWISRNDIVVNKKFTCRSIVVRNIKLKAFLWASNLKLVYGLQAHVWEQNPYLLCQ
ncbi:uncharacterized protein [Rutidosis leptorrhynchoides]|uniref:uncharacterized protein n=1 Tax=Rutidosis leptorrhynchoides TaxID=125765 RepID=UPI003A994937